VFGRRRREQEAAAEAAREAERRELFARLAERPEHICPFLGLAGDRTGYVDGVSDEHRCFAFGEPAPLSAEQQTRVCQERGYGNCPRYLRGVLVIPTEELEALRHRRAPLPEPEPVVAAAGSRRRRAAPILLLVAALLLLVGGAGAYLLFGEELGIAGGDPSPTPSPTVTATAVPTESATPEPSPSPTAEPTEAPTPSPLESGEPTPEPTPEAGDAFAFYEVAVSPGSYILYSLDQSNEVDGERGTSFAGFSFAQAEPAEGADGEVYWVTSTGDLTGWAYLFPDSGDFEIRAVFLSDTGERRSAYLDQDDLTVFPEETPAP
jgi:cell division septation protein DedD